MVHVFNRTYTLTRTAKSKVSPVVTQSFPKAPNMVKLFLDTIIVSAPDAETGLSVTDVSEFAESLFAAQENGWFMTGLRARRLDPAHPETPAEFRLFASLKDEVRVIAIKLDVAEFRDHCGEVFVEFTLADGKGVAATDMQFAAIPDMPEFDKYLENLQRNRVIPALEVIPFPA